MDLGFSEGAIAERVIYALELIYYSTSPDSRDVLLGSVMRATLIGTVANSMYMCSDDAYIAAAVLIRAVRILLFRRQIIT